MWHDAWCTCRVLGSCQQAWSNAARSPTSGPSCPPPSRPAIIPSCHPALSAGLPTPGTQLRVVDPETLCDVPDGQQGLILARGPGVMAGYYRDEAATAKVRACAWARRQPRLSWALEPPQTRSVGMALLLGPQSVCTARDAPGPTLPCTAGLQGGGWLV